jgi:hypothetical protein
MREPGDVEWVGPNPAGIGLFGPTCSIFPGPPAAFPAGPVEPAWPKAVCAPPSQPRIANVVVILNNLHMGDYLLKFVSLLYGSRASICSEIRASRIMRSTGSVVALP